MIKQKDEPAPEGKSGQAKRASPSGASQEQSGGGYDSAGRSATDREAERPPTLGAGDRSSATRASVALSRRKRRYLIGRRSMMGIAWNAEDPYIEKLALMEGVEVIHRLRRRTAQTPAAGAGTAPAEIVSVLADE
jgi:hypothetical protein